MKMFFAVVIASMTISGMAFASAHGPCSEETGTCECPAGKAMYGMECDGEWCDNNTIYCWSATTGHSYWTPVFYDNSTFSLSNIENDYKNGLGADPELHI